MNIIFDSNIYELADNQINDDKAIMEHFNYLSDIIDFLKKHNLNGAVICSLDEYLAISNMKEHPWNQYNSNNKSVSLYNILPVVFNDFLQLIDYTKEFKKNLSLPAIPEFVINYSTKNNSLCHNEFLKHIAEIEETSKYVVFMGIINHNLTTPLWFSRNYLQINDKIPVDPIMNFNDIYKTSFSGSYRNLLLFNRITEPNINNPFPNADICSQYISIGNELIKKGGDKIIVYKSIFKEVALRNGYIENNHLTHLNSSNSILREIYSSKTTPTIHICADIRHGTIELCNHFGKHQGEYTYSGDYIKNSKDETGKHDIIV